MGALPVLFVVIAIVNIVLNYKKAADKRLEDQKKRIQMQKDARASAEAAQDVSHEGICVVHAPSKAEPIQKTVVTENKVSRSRVNAKDMQRAVIMSEILNKPVSLRKE